MSMTHSAVRSPASSHYQGRNVPWLLAHWAAVRPDHPFLIWEPFSGATRSWSYRQFHAEVRRLAAGLAALGVKPTERVLIHLDNCPESLLAWYACAELGAVGVTTNTRSVGPEVAYFAAHSQAVGAITQPAHADLIAREAKGIRWLAVTDNDAGASPLSSEFLPDQAIPFGSLLADSMAPAYPSAALAPAGIQYTSGTTSRPKAVVWTHANALWGAQINARHLELTSNDVTLTHLPLFHTNAQSYSVLGSLWVGGTVVLQPRFSASRFWEVSLRHGCTWSSMIPFCLKALLQQERPPRHSYRVWGNGICAPPTDAYFGVTSLGWWGMTETITHGIVGDLHFPNASLSCGRPAPEYEIAVLDDDGVPVDPGETGHLLIRGIRGVSLFLEYLDNPEATRDSFDEAGWFRTGDRVRPMPDGHVFFADRDKDMLKVGGENVAASEIESVIRGTGWIDEVAVVAQRHPMLDEVPAAFVIANPDAPADLAARLIDHCRTQLADFKVPRNVMVVDELPRSTLEKINKAELRKRLPVFE
ncbi:MAG TPA: AMP-binding protein [Pseudomonadales bacterium]|nr:AMP-binding protein [Pseudomonadales bacterium]